jgi:glycosyltransferase involved in cell wall biosynthesis
MKIAHLISTFPPRLGGMGNVCLEEVKRLAAEHEVAVFTLAYPGDAPKDEKFIVRRLKPILRAGDAGWITGLSKILRGFDIVHLHYPFYGALGAVIKAKKLLGFHLVVTYHMDPQRRGAARIVQNLYDKIYARKLFAIADKVIAVDADYFRESKFGRFIGKEKSVILNNGVDLSIFNFASAVAPLALWRDKPEFVGKKIILFVGNFLPVKNLRLLIKILPNLGDDVVLAIVGGGYAEKEIRSLINSANLEKRVVFLGREVNRDMLADFYRASSVVAVPSLSESFSLVAMEAMASGAVLAASDIAGIRGRINNQINGFLFEANNEQVWTDGLRKILDMSLTERQIISERASESAKKYSVEEHVRKLQDIYLTLK